MKETEQKAYIRMPVSKRTRDEFKAACAIAGKPMNKVLQDLMEKYAEEKKMKQV